MTPFDGRWLRLACACLLWSFSWPVLAQTSCAPSLATGLKAWLPLDETSGTTAADAAGQLAPAQLQNGVWQPTGGVDGRGALRLPEGATLTIPLQWQPSAYSVSWWINPGRRFQWSQAVVAGAWGNFAFHSTPSGAIYAGTDVDTRFYVPTNELVVSGAWQQFTFTFDQGTARLYKNGQLLASRTGMNPSGQWPYLQLNASGNDLYDELRVYDRAVSAAEAQALYQCSFASATAQCPTLMLPALKPVTIEPGSATTLRATARQGGTALNFDGLDDQVIIPGLLQDVTNSFTVEAWVKPTTTHEIDGMQTGGVEGAYNQRYLIFPLWGGNFGSEDHAGMGLSVGTNGVSVYEHSGNYLPPLLVWEGTLTEWTHVAVIYQDRIPYLYVNGRFVKKGMQSPKAFVHPSLNLGGDVYGYYQGQADEVRIWNRVRTSQELLTNRTHPIDPASPGLVGYWRLDEGQGERIADASASPHPGLLTRGVYTPNGNWQNPNPPSTPTGPQWVAPSPLALNSDVTYTWSPAAGLDRTSGPLVVASPSVTTTYTVTATSPTSCRPVSQAVTVTVVPPPPVRNAPTADACPALAGTAPDPVIQAPADMNYVRTYTPRVALSEAGATGRLLREQWNNLSDDGSVSSIPIANQPVVNSYLSSFEGPSDIGNTYGDRIRGYLHPAQTGSYTFWIAGDDNCELWLSMDDNPATKRRIASVPGWTYQRQWDKYLNAGEQRSDPQLLVAGHRYYVEVLHKQGYGGDNVAVAWQRDGGIFEGPIPGTYLSAADAATGTANLTVAQPTEWTVEQAQVKTEYLDGLGRPVQQVLWQESPGKRDLVQPLAYDNLGRQPKNYLPYAVGSATGQQGSYHFNALREQDDFYRSTASGPGTAFDNVVRTGVAYGEKQFEASPLNRVLQQASPGEAYSLSSGHAVGLLERPNTDDDQVAQFTSDYTTIPSPMLATGTYAAGALWVSETRDENGGRVQQFKDKQGQLVCKQVQTILPGGTLGGLQNEYGRLRLNAPPGTILTGIQRASYGTGSGGAAETFALGCGAEVTPQVQQLVTAQLAAHPQWLEIDVTNGNMGGDPCGGPVKTLAVLASYGPDPAAPTQWLRTYYVYDELQHLRVVVPPKASQALGAGTVSREEWQNIPGSSIQDIPLSTPATSTSQLTSLDGPVNTSYHNYGDRTRGYLVAPQDGSYTFWVAGDDQSEFWLSLDQDPGRKQRIAWVPGWTGWKEWGKYSEQRSSNNLSQPLVLVKGQRYYFELLHKEGDGGNSVSVSWQLPDGTWDQQPISGAYLQPYEAPIVASISSLLFRYRYDGRGRQIAKQVPGQEGETLLVYDQLDRPVLSQDAAQRQRQEWSWTKYDALGRPVLTGLVTRAASAAQLQAEADAASGQYEQRTPDGPHYYSLNQAYPALSSGAFTGAQVLTVTYYDDYNFDNDQGNQGNGTPDATFTSYASQFPNGPAPTADSRVLGLVTRTKTRVLGVDEQSTTDAPWLVATTFYDAQQRPVQVVSTNARGGQDVVTSQLDFTGKVLKSYSVHQGLNHEDINVAETFAYDHAGRLLQTQQQVGAEPAPVTVAQHRYNEVGQLVTKTLSPDQAITRQVVDYTYTVRGSLRGINEDFVTGATPAGSSSDLWGLRLSYDCGFQVAQYNGNISGQQWRGRDGVARAYGYSYDLANRLLQGDFIAQDAATGKWTAEQQHYALLGMRYDENGNILALQRRGLLQNSTRRTPKQYGAVDDLAYGYTGAQGNRLVSVEDQVTGNALPQAISSAAALTSLAGDFQEKSRAAAGQMPSAEYSYDVSGNLTADANKGITGIVYNHLNLPTKISFSAQDYLEYRYSASGQKVAKFVHQAGQSAVQRTDYLGPYQYEQDSLRFFSHAEGRVLRFVSYDKANQAQLRYVREYTLKDHLGNLRLAYRPGDLASYQATMEPALAADEEKQFEQGSLTTTRTYVGSSSARSPDYVAKLNAAQGTPIGPLKLLPVQKGDVITVVAPGYAPQAVSSGSSFTFSLLSFVTSLLQQPTPVLGEVGLVSKKSSLPFLGLGLGIIPVLNQNGQVPKAYVRALVFDQDSVPLSQYTQTQQLSAAALGGYEELRLNVTAPRDGFVQVYVGNESDVDVYFDDVTITYQSGLLVQENQYDPWGLNLAGLDYASPGIKGLNDYQYNGKELQQELALNLIDYGARLYDAQLGLWHNIDPLADAMRRHSPYNYGFDNPIRFVDHDGMGPGEGENKADTNQGNWLTRAWSNLKGSFSGFFSSFEGSGVYRDGKKLTPEQVREEAHPEGMPDEFWVMMAFDLAGSLNHTPVAPSSVESPVEELPAAEVPVAEPIMEPAAETVPAIGEVEPLAQRATDLHNILPESWRGYGTTAVTEVKNADGTISRIVGSNKDRLPPVQRAALRPGEVEAGRYPGDHAEVTTLKSAAANGQTPLRVAASRPICPECHDAIKAAGAQPASPLKKTK